MPQKQQPTKDADKQRKDRDAAKERDRQPQNRTDKAKGDASKMKDTKPR